MLPNPHSTDGHGGENHQIDPEIDISDISLYPEEEITRVQRVGIRKPSQPLSATNALELLAGVKESKDIGTKGPVIAAMAFPEDKDVVSLRLYEVLFGRDSLISASFLLQQYPNLARATLIALARLQGVNKNIASEEEAGKILHEYRDPNDPIALELTKRRGWQWPYYGSVDATPRFISLLASYVIQFDADFLNYTYQAHDGSKKTMLEACIAALGWIKSKMAANREGLLESVQLNKVGGNAIQSWKDSVDSHHHQDGSLANWHQGIVSIEVQGLAYDALVDGIKILELSDTHTSKTGKRRFKDEILLLKGLSVSLKEYVLDTYWVEDKQGGYFALGSDRDLEGHPRLLNVRTSNMGHLLASQLLDGEDKSTKEKIRKTVQTLLSPLLSSPHGIRTLANCEKRYRPNNYHNGSIWPWDSYQVSLGLLHRGYREEAYEIWDKILRIPQETGQFPEFISGNDTGQPVLPNRIISVFDSEYKIERNIEQPPQQIQAWTVAAVAAIEYQKSAAASA